MISSGERNNRKRDDNENDIDTADRQERTSAAQNDDTRRSTKCVSRGSRDHDSWTTASRCLGSNRHMQSIHSSGKRHDHQRHAHWASFLSTNQLAPKPMHHTPWPSLTRATNSTHATDTDNGRTKDPRTKEDSKQLWQAHMMRR